MTQEIGLDPFIDYSKITDEMVTDLCGAVREKVLAEQELISQPSRHAAERIMKAVDNLSDTVRAIEGTLFTVPAIIHNPGQPKEEDLNGVTVTVQRCTRCSSPLHGWQPGMMTIDENGPREVSVEEVSWAEVGKPTAKVNHPNGGGMIYLVEGDPEPHERECVQMPDMSL